MTAVPNAELDPQSPQLDYVLTSPSVWAGWLKELLATGSGGRMVVVRRASFAGASQPMARLQIDQHSGRIVGVRKLTRRGLCTINGDTGNCSSMRRGLRPRGCGFESESRTLPFTASRCPVTRGEKPDKCTGHYVSSGRSPVTGNLGGPHDL